MGMTIDFTGKTVLVTGAAKGLGKDMALLFASCGANVHIGEFNTEEAEKTVAELKNFGVKADFTKCDVSNEEEVQKMVEDAKALGNGKLDAVVNAAGVISIQDLLYTNAKEMQRVLNINVVGSALVLKHSLEIMMKQKSGNIILVSSIAGREGMDMLQIYCASKAGVTSLVQSGARRGAPYNVRVNGILPGIIRTSMWEEILDGMSHNWDPNNKEEVSPEVREELWKKSVESLIPLGHAQSGKDIAYATAFLASDFAKEITSECLSIDGGTTVGR